MAGLFFSEYIEGSSNNKALEIFNDTGAAVDLAAGGYVVQFFFNGSTTAGTTIALTGTIAPGEVYVLADNDAAAEILAQADQTSMASFYNGDDAIVLRQGGAAGAVVDSIGQVGFDPGSEWGSGLTSMANNTLRRRDTTPDTNPNDAFDPAAQWDGFAEDTFDGLGSFSGGGSTQPSLSLSVSPASVAESAGATAATGTISRTGDTTAALTVTLASSDSSEAIVPTTIDIPAGAASVTFAIAAVDDTAVDGDQPVTLTASAIGFANASASLTVTDDDVPAAVRIRDIQGTAQVSPLVGQTVNNVPGIVTAVRSNGFFFQDPDPDSSDVTSEGIFVFTSSAPTVAVGDSILVSGRVSEFRPGGNSTTNLSTTQIGSPTISRLSSGNPLPTATILGNGGRTIPTAVIDNDTTGGNVETNSVFDPAEDGIDFYESVEGMLVQVNNAVAVSPTNNFGEIAVLADNGANAGIRTPRGGIIIQPSDFNPERIIIDDAIVPNEPQVNVGDTFNGAIVGVVDYSFGNFKLLNTQPLPSVQSANLNREVTALQGTSNQLTVAAFNVENLDPADGNVRFAALADSIVTNLKAPDIISLEEVQDNNGATNDSIVDADVTYQTLIEAIVAAGGPRYEFRQINPVDDQDGGQPGGNIRVGFLFNPNRVDFVDRPGGSPTTATAVNSVNGEPELSASPGRLDPTNPAFNSSRKPLVGEFVFNGETVFVIGNHFNSKGGDDPLFGRNQPPELSSEVQRSQQAQIVNDFVESLLAVDPTANVVALGDFNDFQFSTPLRILLQGNDASQELFNLYDKLPFNEQYSYIFDGNSQVLDHILVSDRLNGIAEVDVVHINSEFADQISDHDPLVARFTFAPTFNSIAGTAANDTLRGTEGRDRILGLDGNDRLFGLGGNDILDGGSGNDFLDGGAGDDQLNGGAGSDRYVANSSGDRAIELANAGLDGVEATVSFTLADNLEWLALTGTAAIDGEGNDLSNVLTGNAANNSLLGRAGNDVLVGLDGDDLLDGGAGRNILTGGAGSDRFVVREGQQDTILDFANNRDLLALSGLTFGQLSIEGRNRSTIISANGQQLVVLPNVRVSTITSSDFVTI